MALNHVQDAKVQAWLQKHFTSCRYCGGNQMAGGDIIAGSSIGPGGSVQIGGATTPMLQVICTKCAYVHLFAAVPMGLP